MPVSAASALRFFDLFPESDHPRSQSNSFMTLPHNTIIHILGGGSIGLLFAAKLSRFAKVHIIPRSGVATATRFKIESLDGDISEYSLENESNPHANIDWLFVCTKSYDAEQAVNLASKRLSRRSIIVLFGNGMGYQQNIAKSYPECTLIVASTTEGANRPTSAQINTPETMCVRHAGKGKTVIGIFNKNTSGATTNGAILELRSLSNLLNKAGFENEISDDIQAALWRKLIVNCGINPFTAILNCTNGSILQHPFFRARIDGLCSELATSAQRAGFAITADECKKSVIDVATATQHNRSSMLQDCSQSKITEIDFINGFICQQGDKYGQDYPINRELIRGVKELKTNIPNSPTTAKS